MLKSFKRPFLVIALLLAGGTMASAATVLDGWAVNLDGLFVSFDNFSVATAANIPNRDEQSTFDAGTIDVAGGLGQIGPGGTGLGTLGINVFGEGTHTVLVLLDLHIDTGDFSFFDEFAGTSGSVPTGLTWQIDDPYNSNIAANVAAGGALPNINALPNPSGGDVSVALAYTFLVPHLQGGTRVNFNVSFTSGTPELNPSTFYILQNSNEAPGTIAFSAGLEAIPEPSGWVLIVGGLGAIVALRMRRGAAE